MVNTDGARSPLIGGVATADAYLMRVARIVHMDIDRAFHALAALPVDSRLAAFDGEALAREGRARGSVGALPLAVAAAGALIVGVAGGFEPSHGAMVPLSPLTLAPSTILGIR